MSQLFFNFQQNDSESHSTSDSVYLPLKENYAAEKFFRQFFSQKDFTASPFSSASILGEKFSGSKALLQHLCHAANATKITTFIAAKEIEKDQLKKLFQPNQFLVVENIEEIASEELFLNVINLAVESHSFLIVTHSQNFDFKLPDLRSRIQNFFRTRIEQPQAESVAILIQNLMSQKQIRLPQNIVEFVALNLPRNYEKAYQFADAAETFCHENGKNFTLEMAKNILNQLN